MNSKKEYDSRDIKSKKKPSRRFSYLFVKYQKFSKNLLTRNKKKLRGAKKTSEYIFFSKSSQTQGEQHAHANNYLQFSFFGTQS